MHVTVRSLGRVAPHTLSPDALASVFDGSPAPARLSACVAVPIRDEAERLPRTLEALCRQERAGGGAFAPDRFEIVLLLNNCSDGSMEAVLSAAACGIRIWAIEADLPEACAHVGQARRLAMDLAERRLAGTSACRPFIATTDGDTIVAADWLHATAAEIAAGADLVGGELVLDPAEVASLDPAIGRCILLDRLYRQLSVDLLGLLSGHDAGRPRHYHHTGASLAVTRDFYLKAGRLPVRQSGEDTALVERVQRLGGRIRLSRDVRAVTSCRVDGRAARGMAATLAAWGVRGQDGLRVPGASALLADTGLGHTLRARLGLDPSARLPIVDAIAEIRRCLLALGPLQTASAFAGSRGRALEQIEAPAGLASVEPVV